MELLLNLQRYLISNIIIYTITGGKLHYWEGGIRVPGIFHWPGHIKPSSISDVIASQMDLFPTLMNIAGGCIPKDRIMDGQDISSAIFNWSPEPQPQPAREINEKSNKHKKEKDDDSTPRLLVFYCSDVLFAVRYGCYKFHFHTQETMTQEERHAAPGFCGEAGYPYQQNINCWVCTKEQADIANFPGCISEHDPLLMYNICEDPKEAYPLNVTLPANKAVIEQMNSKLEEFLDDYEPGPALLDSFNHEAWPCCTPETFPNCTCNYEYEGPIPPPGLAVQLENSP